ncbi:unnamed protein product [Candidula unifasciata]|uniref:G-protein coupled receptors family 1 profile domain-containing protein n=1 Tax=Candidula unifasciata TaxID=100452 RepID=A0A8S3YHD0_9EUPU|nr:unnamed protein product [Candidula unifasciata]
MESSTTLTTSLTSDSENSSVDNFTINLTPSAASVLFLSSEMRSNTVLVSCLMFSAGVIGNLLALLLMATSPAEQKRTIFYKLMAGLAFTDLVGTCATSPVVITIYSTGLKMEKEMPLCHYFSFMMIFAGFATMSLVCAMAIERYICLCHPYIYHCKLPKSYAKYAIMSCWLMSIIIATLPLIGLGHNAVQYPRTWCFFNATSREAQDVAFNLIYATIALMAILATLICNVATIVSVLALRRRQNALSASQDPVMRRYRSPAQRYAELHMVVMLVGVTIVFTVCFGPLMVIRRELRWKIICLFKYIFGMSKPPVLTTPVIGNDSPVFSHRMQRPVNEMSCLSFCFHCLCDPPTQRSSASLGHASTARFGLAKCSPSYVRRIASVESVLNGASKTCVISPSSPSEEFLLQKFCQFKTDIATYAINGSPHSQLRT